MNRAQTLAWLAEFQAGFSEALCTPLDPSGGTLHANTQRYGAAVVKQVDSRPPLPATERLAVYNRQYWFRLLRTLQQELPLTSRLFGLWSFNQRAMAFLRVYPPHGQDLGQVCLGFERYLARALTTPFVPCPELETQVPSAALQQAAELDLTFRRVFLAPPQPRFRPFGDDDCGDPLRLQPSAAYARFEELWPLVRLRSPLLSPDSPHVIPLPPALPFPQTWALFRNARGVGQLPLEPGHARLLALLEERSLGEALTQLERETSAQERDALPKHVQGWLAQSARLGFFRGVERPET